MDVNELMRDLRKLQKEGHGKTELYLFAHDHDPDDPQQGVGGLFSVSKWENEEIGNFIALRT